MSRDFFSFIIHYERSYFIVYEILSSTYGNNFNSERYMQLVENSSTNMVPKTQQ